MQDYNEEQVMQRWLVSSRELCTRRYALCVVLFVYFHNITNLTPPPPIPAQGMSIKDRLAMLQKEKDDDGPPKTYKTSAAPTHYDDSAPTQPVKPKNSGPTQPVKPKSGRSLLRRLSIEKIQELRRSSTASETVDNVDDWDDEMKMKMKKKNTSPSERDMTSIVDHEMTTTPRALTEEEVRSLRTILKKELHICDDSHAEDADDLLDYAMEMIEEGQSVGCVTDEVSLSNSVQFSSIYVSYSISSTFLAIALDELKQLNTMEMEVFPREVSDCFGKCLSRFLLGLAANQKRLEGDDDTQEENKKTTLQTLQDNSSVLTTTAMQNKKNKYQVNTASTTPSRPSITRRASASLSAAASVSLKERISAYQKQQNSSVDADVSVAVDNEENMHEEEERGENEEVEDKRDDAAVVMPEEKPQVKAASTKDQAVNDNPTKLTTSKAKKKKSFTSFFRKKK